MYIQTVIYYFSQALVNDQFAGIWRSDGTSAGTFPIFSGPDKTVNEFGFSKQGHFPVGTGIGNDFYFIASQQIADTVYTNLYKTDGTSEGTHVYFQLDKQNGDINSTHSERVSVDIIGFNDHIYFNYSSPHDTTGTEIWVGDGIDPPHELCDFNPGLSGTMVDQWVNVNDKYVAANVGIEHYAGDQSLQPELIRINAGDTCPLILDDDISDLHLIGPENNGEAAISGDKLFFIKSTKANDRVTEVTDGTTEGTIVSSLDCSSSGLIGVCTKGAIYSGEFGYSLKTYIWDGNASNSFHIFSDSLGKDNWNYHDPRPEGVIQLDTTVFVTETDYGKQTVFQTNADGSYCYRVGSLIPLGRGVDLGDTAYLAFGSPGFVNATNIFYDCGVEPVILKSYDKTWTGKISNDWDNADNWLPSGVPKFSQSVVIPPTQHDPVINNQAACKDLFLNDRGITVNKSANLDVHGYYFDLGVGITGAGSLTRKGTFANTTYGYCRFDIDSINIDGADWDLTSIPSGTIYINSVVNFKSDNKLIMNQASIYMEKKPFFTGFNNKRYVLDNRPDFYFDDGSDKVRTGIMVANLGDSVITIPVGTSTSSYSPLTFTHPYYQAYDAFTTYMSNEVRDKGNNGDAITAGVVNKTWTVRISDHPIDKIKLSWVAADELPGFNRNACFIAYYDGSKWIKGITQSATLNNGVYSIEQDGVIPDYPFIVSGENVLAVDLTNFTAELINADTYALLQWQTQTEINAAHFNVQRSVDGINFTTIGKLNAAGNSSLLKTYSYTDNIVELNNSTIYYRIEEVDKDGKTTLSKIAVVNLNRKGIALRLMPNPVKEKLSVQITNYTGNAVVHIYDMQGREVYHNKTATNNININTAALKAGTYLIDINANGTILKQKFVKE